MVLGKKHGTGYLPYTINARKKYKCSILICTFFYHYYSIFYHAASKYSYRIKSISITFDTSLNMISLRNRVGGGD